MAVPLGPDAGIKEDARLLAGITTVLPSVPGIHVSVGVAIDCGTVTVGTKGEVMGRDGEVAGMEGDVTGIDGEVAGTDSHGAIMVVIPS